VSGEFVVSLTRAKDDTDRATVAFVVANAAIASEKEVVVFLNIEGTRLSQSGYPDDLHEAGFSPCFKKRALHEPTDSRRQNHWRRDARRIHG
jgi:predicted peroxiredoxin